MVFLCFQFGGRQGGVAVVLLFGLLRIMAIFLPSESRTLYYIDRAINSQSTFVSRPLHYNQLTLHLLSIYQANLLWQCLCSVLFTLSFKKFKDCLASCPPTVLAQLYMLWFCNSYFLLRFSEQQVIPVCLS